jgi:8-oxo-dGTP diphosphatase
VPDARARLSYARDADVLDDFASGPADTVPCIMLRHSGAGSKESWPGDDLLRPLDAQGLRDAEVLARLLGCYARRRVISSPARRCVATVEPYAAMAGLVIETEPAFLAGPAAAAPSDWMLPARQRIEDLVGDPVPAVICAHRENLPVLLDWVCARLGAKVPDGPPLQKSAFWVLHIGGGTVAAAERHHPPAA